MIRMRIKTTK